MGTAVLGQYNEVLGVDLELEAIHFARGFYPWIPFWCNDVTTVALPKVDVVVAIEMLEHVTDASAVAARLAKLAPTIWLSTPNRAGREQLHDHRHVREYYPDEIREMFPAFDCAAVLEAEGSVLYRMELDL
jgi:2-polyprenyl-3-methyl-5-hydroxy-6-metoxy-1,4-benzoquinol methylase